MVPLLFILLIISQLICFYFIILLNTKVAKFKDLEVRQDKLMREMDDAIGVYLMEMREENDRLIKELSVTNTAFKNNDTKKLNMTILNEAKTSSINVTKEENDEKELLIKSKSIVPKNIAKNAYNRQKENIQSQKSSKTSTPIRKPDLAQKEKSTSVELAFEQQVLKLHSEGKTVEEIAKITQKGKTEIELLIKFHV